jgi:hypothetical protein
MFVRKKALSKDKIVVQLCENQRCQGRVKQHVLRHVGTANTEDSSAISRLLEIATLLKQEFEQARQQENLLRSPLLPFESPLEVPEQKIIQEIPLEKPEELFDTSKLSEERRVVEGIHAVFGAVLDKFGLQPLLGTQKYNVLHHLMMARIAWPSSKLRASDNLLKRFNIDISEDRIYRLMDALEGQEEAIQKVVFWAIRPLMKERVEVLFFDVTTLYFESTDEDELRRYGFSKDQKTHLTQVVLALATTGEGLPVGYKLFSGNTAETSTLLAAIKEWRGFLDIQQVTIVADRAMMNDKNLKELEESGMKYVIAAKLKKLPKALRESILQRSSERQFLQEGELVAVQEHTYEGRRLIVSYNDKRARKDARDREQILNKLEKKIGKRGSTKKLVTNRGYLSVVKESGDSRVQIDEEKVQEASRWDGLHGVITNVEGMSAEEALSTYRRLWVIEESFRINKHTLEMRPIYHHIARRIRAHILLCYLEFAVSRYVEKRVSMHCGSYSIDRIRSILIDVQYSVLKREGWEGRYHLPSSMTIEARQIYSVFGLKRPNRLVRM